MKTISGKVVSSKPVSLSRAARILSKFASSDNGASPAFAAYLKRASASFNELVQLHKELKGSSPECKRNKHRSDNTAVEDAAHSVGRHTDEGMTTEEKREIGERKKHKKGKRAEGEDRELEGSLKTDYEHKGHNNKRGEGDLSTGGKSEGSTNRSAIHMIGDGKKKKKTNTYDVHAMPEKEQVRADFDLVHADGVKNGFEVEDGSKEIMKKTKKKKKQGDVFAEIEVDEQNCSCTKDAGYSEAAEMVPDDGSKPNKSDKNIKEKRTRNIEGADIGGGGAKKHKKQIYGGEETDGGRKIEIQEANKKDSGKKHRELAHGGLDHSKEPYRSKEKKSKVDLIT